MDEEKYDDGIEENSYLESAKPRRFGEDFDLPLEQRSDEKTISLDDIVDCRRMA
jgi:hypothetical protein